MHMTHTRKSNLEKLKKYREFLVDCHFQFGLGGKMIEAKRTVEFAQYVYDLSSERKWERVLREVVKSEYYRFLRRHITCDVVKGDNYFDFRFPTIDEEKRVYVAACVMEDELLLERAEEACLWQINQEECTYVVKGITYKGIEEIIDIEVHIETFNLLATRTKMPSAQKAFLIVATKGEKEDLDFGTIDSNSVWMEEHWYTAGGWKTAEYRGVYFPRKKNPNEGVFVGKQLALIGKTIQKVSEVNSKEYEGMEEFMEYYFGNLPAQ